MKLKDKRFHTVIKRLELDQKKEKGKKFLIIQVDGLSYDILRKFMSEGGCKVLKKLINKEGYKLHKWNCGVPSGTPTVQSGILYGKNQVVPGFRFIEKKEKRQFSFGNPNDVKYFEHEHFSSLKGLLEGGSSYSNHFSGGAHRSILTMSTITKNKKFKRIRESSIWLFLFIHPASLFRVVYYSLAELTIEAASIISYPFDRYIRRRRGIYSFWMPFRRLLMNSILAELITMGVLLDIKRGVPRIYVNYLNFDDIAHNRGPDSNAAYFMVRATERRIKRILKKTIDYDVHILSDHGMMPAIPFESIEGKTLAEYIESCSEVESTGLTSSHEGRLTIMGVVLGKTLIFLRFVSSPLRWIGTKFVKGVFKVIKPRKKRIDWAKGEQIIVCDSCSLAHIYFTSSKARLKLDEIDKKYPGLTTKLLNSKGIGVIMAKQGKKTFILGKTGLIVAEKKQDGNFDLTRKGQDFLKKYGDSKILLDQLLDFSDYENMGDLTVFGNTINGKIVSFTQHVGSHGGIGGNMTWPFIITRKKYDFSKVRNAREMNKIFGN